MTSEDMRVEGKKWKSYRRQQQDSDEEAKQAKLASTEFNRGVGDMMRYVPRAQESANGVFLRG